MARRPDGGAGKRTIYSPVDAGTGADLGKIQMKLSKTPKHNRSKSKCLALCFPGKKDKTPKVL